MKNPILLIAAAEFELQPTVAALSHQKVPFEVALCGIGALAAAKRSGQLQRLSHGRHVVFIGTAGSFQRRVANELVRVRKVFWSPPCERSGLSYTVANSAPPIDLPKPPAWALGLPEVLALGSPTISLTDHLPKHLLTEDDPLEPVENLEIYSCAAELIADSASFVAILAVTNQIGKNAHGEWRENHRQAATDTAAFVSKNINVDGLGLMGELST